MDYHNVEQRFARAKRKLEGLTNSLTPERLDEIRRQTTSSEWQYAFVHFAPDPMKIAEAAISAAKHDLEEARGQLIATLNADRPPTVGAENSANVVAIPKRKAARRTGANSRLEG